MKRVILVLLSLALMVACGDNDGRTTNETRATTASTVAVGAAATATSEPVEVTVAPTEIAVTPTPAAPTVTATEAATAPATKPAATATPVTEADVQVGKWARVSATYGGTTYIIGDVTNVGTGDAAEVEVVISAYDATGAIIGSQTAYEILPIIKAGGKSPFRAALLDVDNNSIAEVKIQVQFSQLDDASLGADYFATAFTISQINWTEGSINGEVLSNETKAVSGTLVIAIGYDANGEVVGVETMYAKLDQLDPGMTSPFGSSSTQWPAATTVEAFASARYVQ